MSDEQRRDITEHLALERELMAFLSNQARVDAASQNGILAPMLTAAAKSFADFNARLLDTRPAPPVPPREPDRTRP